jgi:hypothetical protein
MSWRKTEKPSLKSRLAHWSMVAGAVVLAGGLVAIFAFVAFFLVTGTDAARANAEAVSQASHRR